MLTGLKISPFYDTFDNTPKALIDLASVDRYHPTPDADLPRQPFGVLPLIHLGLLSSCLSEGQIPPATLREGTGPEPQETFAEDSPSPQMVEMGICLNKSKRNIFVAGNCNIAGVCVDTLALLWRGSSGQRS